MQGLQETNGSSLHDPKKPQTANLHVSSFRSHSMEGQGPPTFIGPHGSKNNPSIQPDKKGVE